jgi:hypothetical protein
MSKKNQNFRKNPDMQIIQSILETFGLDNLEDDRFFTKEHMKEINTKENLILLKPRLEEYYLPCKAKEYLNNITEKRCVCILRQLVKNYNYKVIGIEKSVKGNKETTYRLMYLNQEFLSPKKEPEIKRKYIVSFDT